MAVLDFITKHLRYHKVLPLIKQLEDCYNRPLSILDAGGSAGDFHKILRSRGHNVLVCDLDLDADFIWNLENPLPFKDKEFDLSVSLAVVEHLNNYSLFLDELKRVSCNVIVTTPTVRGKYVLELLATLRLVNKSHIDDHKYYLSVDDFIGKGYSYKTFFFGLNSVACYSDFDIINL